MRGTWGCCRSGLVSVLDLCILVGCRSGGGASVRIGIEVSLPTPELAPPGFRTKDFPHVAFLEGAIVSS